MGNNLGKELTHDHRWTLGERVMMFCIMISPCFFIRMELDNDAYWIIRSGRYVLEQGIPHVEPFTLHEGLHFVMQQWLTAAAYAGIYNAAGTAGLIFLVFLLYVSIVFVVHRIALMVGEGNRMVAYAVATADTLLLFLFMTTRPYPISLLIFALELLILEKWVRGGNGRILWMLPILSVLLINLHGAMWLFLFVLALPYVLDSFSVNIWIVKGEGYGRRPLLLALAGAFAVGFVNPYGWESMTYLFRSYGYQEISRFVSEMMPVNFQGGLGFFVYGLMLLVMVILIRGTRPILKLRYALILMGTFFLALNSIRNISLFAACGIPLMAFPLRNAIPPIKDSSVLRPALRNAIVATLIVLLSFSFLYRLNESRHWVDEYVPTEAAEYVVNHYNAQEIRLYGDYNWGGYLEYKGLRPFIDARAEVFLKSNNRKEDILGDFIDQYGGATHYKSFIEKYGLNVFLLSKEDPLYVNLSRDKDFVCVFQDEDAAVIVDAGLLRASWVDK